MESIDPVDAVRRHGGIADRSALLELVSRRSLDKALSERVLERHGRSSIALPGMAADLAAAHRADGVMTGLTAARSWGWQVKAVPTRPLIAVPRHRHHAYPGIDLLRRDLRPEDVSGRRLTRAATVIECARTLTFDEALSVADSALRERRLTRADLVTQAAQLPRVSARVTRIVESADGRSANPFESVARAIALDVPGLHVEPQGWVGGDRHSDLVDQHLRIAIECDSWSFHADDRAWRYDVRRYNELVLDGWLVLRLLWEQVMAQQPAVHQLLCRAVALASSRRA